MQLAKDEWAAMLTGLKANDEAAWTALYKDLATGGLGAMIKCRWRDQYHLDYAGDIWQTVREMKSLDHVQDLRAYLSAMVRFTFMTAIKNQRRESGPPITDRDQGEVLRHAADMTKIPSPEPSAEEMLLESERQRKRGTELKRLAVARLAPQERKVLQMKLQGLTAKQVATKSGLSEAGVRCAASNAKLKLVRAIHTTQGGPKPAPKPKALTGKEAHVFRLWLAGVRQTEIARQLGVTSSTANAQLIAVKRKAKAKTMVDLVLFAVRDGWIALDGTISLKAA